WLEHHQAQLEPPGASPRRPGAAQCLPRLAPTPLSPSSTTPRTAALCPPSPAILRPTPSSAAPSVRLPIAPSLFCGTVYSIWPIGEPFRRSSSHAPPCPPPYASACPKWDESVRSIWTDRLVPDM